MIWRLFLIGCAAAISCDAPAIAAELDGPARFCGYSPIIDLLPGERVETLTGGIHGGSFRWSGDFGSLVVHGNGWASKPKGAVALKRNAKGHVRYASRKSGGEYGVAIWNRRHGAAYFSSPKPLTDAQLTAIDRVDLFNEGEDPDGCDLRTIFSWE
ncbi:MULTISPECIES: hypothetical protein [unclassified Sphingopyxis]|uniref:hypothetical protein n=1 Tax=unclassified Sphingopyxis TaxID=2614943 RepID=UPI000E725A9F|nr:MULTISPECIES: hypothetical protein [unclassified Sphingopyxis]